MNQSQTYGSNGLNSSRTRKSNQIDNEDPVYKIHLDNVIFSGYSRLWKTIGLP